MNKNELLLKEALHIKQQCPFINKLARVEFYEIQRWDPGKIYMKWQFPNKKLQVKFFSKKAIISKNTQPTKNEERAGCIYTLVLHFVLSKQSCISSNKNLC